MAIDFSLYKWDKIKDIYNKFWLKDLDRPVLNVILDGRDPGRIKPNIPLLSQATCADISISADDIIDRLDYDLSCKVFLGDAYPYVNFSSFGPGIISAFLGAKLDNTTGNVWFSPSKILPIKDIHFEYDPDNIWLNRIKDIYRAGIKRWQGQVQLSIPDLGGTLDILSVFRPGENLLLDLYDDPDEVIRLTWEIHDLWHKYYNELKDILDPYNPGDSNWGGVLSFKSSYILQCDFCYMLSPEMFDKFVEEELIESAKKLSNTIYHLDGPGQIIHLDKILNIEDFGGVQWVPGSGNGGPDEWPQIYKKIHQSGKFIHMVGGFDHLDAVINYTGDRKNIYHEPIFDNISKIDTYKRKLSGYGAL